MTVDLTPTEGVALSQKTLTQKDIVDAKTKAKTVATKLTGTAPGDQKISASLTFFLCTDEICQRYKDQTETALKVK